MRYSTFASIAATALALGLLTASPSIAQTTQPAAKSDKMAPARKFEEQLRSAPKSDLLDIIPQRRRTRRAAGVGRPFGGHHRGRLGQG
jgi:hypothetical protein